MIKRSHFITHLWRSMTWDEGTLKPHHPSIELLCRKFEAELADHIKPVIEAYNEGRISASELIMELDLIDDNRELLYDL